MPASLLWIPGEMAATYDRVGLFAKSEPLYREFLEAARQQFGRDHPRAAAAMGQLGRNLLWQMRPAEAEPVLRECLAIRQKREPDAWTAFNAMSMLGDALLGQKQYAEAEPLLLGGYEGMKQRAGKIPGQVRQARLAEALERLVQLYGAWGKPDEAARWRENLATHQQAEKKTEGAKAR
jgi:hypothetical protein